MLKSRYEQMPPNRAIRLESSYIVGDNLTTLQNVIEKGSINCSK